jgi:hypothetical protein
LAGDLAMPGLLGQAVGPDQLPTRMMVCIVNDVPAWSGLIWKVRGGSAGTVELGCATPESYLDRRFVESMSFTGVDQAMILAALGNAANVEGIGLIIDVLPTGVPRDREYWDDEDATYYQRAQELMNISGGPEWTIGTEWRSTTKQSVALRMLIRDRIGSTTPQGPLSTASEAVISYAVTSDYDKGAGANDVMAYSSGEGEDRPQSARWRNEAAIAAGAPRVEHRFSPSSSITNIGVLDGHAQGELGRLDGGTTSIEVVSRWDVAPAQLGIDLLLGDNTGYDLTGHMHPAGITGAGRLIGWTLDTTAGTVTPVLRL